MLKQTPKKRVLFVRRLMPVLLVLFGVFSIAFVNLHSPKLAQAATANTINFQARLQTAAGGIVPDGNYNVEFKLYGASSGGSALWTEDYLNSAGKGLQSINGYITTNLGSITAFSGINWDQPLWLTMNIGGTVTTGTFPGIGDGEMNPRLPLTAVPYAFSAGQLNNTSTGGRSTISFQGSASGHGDQNFLIQDQGAAGTYNLLTAPSGSDGYIKLQGASPVAQTGYFNISGTGIAGALQAGTFDTASAGTLSIGPTNATTVTITPATTVNNTLAINTSNATAFTVTGATTLLTVDTTTARVSIGAVGGCSAAGNGKLCVNQNASISANTTNVANVFTLNTTSGGTSYANRIVVTDTSSAKNNTNYGLYIDASGATNTNAVSNGIFVNNPSGLGGGNLVQLQTGSSDVFKITNSGTATLTGSLNVTAGYSFNGTAGSTTTCSSGNVLQNTTVQGGIITGGTCASAAAGLTGSGTDGTIAMFSGSGTNLGNSILTQSGSDTLNVGGRLNLQGATGNFGWLMQMAGTFNSSYTGAQFGFDNEMNFNPTGASVGDIYGLVNNPTISGSALAINNYFGQSTGIATASGYTGQITNGYGISVTSPNLGGSKKITNYYGINVSGNSTNGSNTSGTLTNTQVKVGGITAGAGSGGTVTNYGILLTQPSGTGGTTNNYGLYIQGNGGGSTNYAIYSTSTAASLLSGSLQATTVNATSGYQFNGTVGSTTTCTSGNVLQNATVQGGIITGGTCVANGGGVAPTLQNVYDNSVTTPVINLSATGKGLFIQDASTTVGGNLFAVQDSTGSNQYLAVTTSGISTNGTASANTYTVTSGNGLDTATAGNLNLGTATANGVTIGRSSAYTTIQGSTLIGNGSVANNSAALLNMVNTYTSGFTGSSNYAINNTVLFTPSSSSIVNIWGNNTIANVGGSNTFSAVTGVNARIGIDSGYAGGTIARGNGIGIQAPTFGAAGQYITDYRGIDITGNTANGGNTSGTVANYQIRIGSNTASAGTGGTLNNYGLYLVQPAGSGGTTNNYGLYISGNGGGSTNYSLYNNSTATSYFAGDIQGSTASFSGNVSGADAVSSNQFVTLSQLTGAVGGVGGGVDTVGTIDGGTYSANGASISGTTIYLQAATGTHVGLLTASAQTLGGDKTFSDGITTDVLNYTSGLNINSTGGGSLTLGSNNSITLDSGDIEIGGAGGTNNFNSAWNNFYGVTTLSQTGQNALAITGAPTNSATSSLIQVGGTIVGGNASANGGTYLGLNAPSSGAGSAADFLNFQKGGTSNFLVDNTGFIFSQGGLTTNGSITVQGAAAVYASEIAASGTFSINGTAGSNTTCSSGNVLQNAVVTGGIITGGTCVANGGGVAPTLQNVYDNSSSTPLITLSSTGHGLFIQDASSTVGGNLFAIQSNGGATKYLAVTTSGASVAGSLTVSTAIQTPSVDSISGSLTLGASASSIIFGSSTNGITFTAAGGLVASGTAQHTKTILLAPEYAGAVLDAAGDSACSSANNGTLTSAYDSTNRMNNYNWTSTSGTAQCYDIVVQVPIPSDFASWSGTPDIEMKKDSTGTGAYAIQIIPSSGNDANYGSGSTYVTGGTLSTSWGDMATASLSGTYTAGDYLTIKVRVTSTSGANVKLGNIKLSYNSKY